MKFRSDALKNLPVAGALLLMAALAVCTALYFTNVQERERYLQSRNFRLLASLGSQTESLIRTSARVESGRISAPQPGAGTTPASSPTGEPGHKLASRALAIGLDGSGLRVQWPWVGDTPRAPLQFTLPPSEFERILNQKRAQRAFDTLALAAPGGEVVMAVGRRRAELQVMSLDMVVSGGGPGAAKHAAWTPGVIGEHQVTLAGVDYRLFVQPCCRFHGPAGTPSVGLVIVGLVEADALKAEAMAISPLLVLAAVLLVLAALVSWAFLKVALVNARERVSPLDALQLGASSVFGLAMATALVLTVAAYARLRADVDGQLERLGEQIQSSLSVEIAAAAAQSRKVTPRLLAAKCGSSSWAAGGADRLACEAEAARLKGELEGPGALYPDYTTVFLAGPDGMQRVKLANDEGAAHMVSVADRDYFNAVLHGRAWRFPACEGPKDLPSTERGCVLESVWSWTTGTAQVVLAHPTSNRNVPVAGIATSMRSVMDTVLPAGLEFAIVNVEGAVQFHADTERQGHENLIVETDRNKPLRALIEARSAGNVNTDYWGRPYRAHVRPAPVPGWSIVTLFDKQHARALVLEWTAASLFLLSGYMLLWIVAMLVAMRWGASWMWPDPFKRSRYRTLSRSYAALLLVFGLVAWQASPATTLYAALALALLAWPLTATALADWPRCVQAPASWAQLDFDYRVMGTLALLLTAVAPGAAFVAFSYDLHMEAYVKHRQIALVHAAQARAPRRADKGAHQLRSLGDYASVFYDSAPPPVVPAGAAAAVPHQHRRLAHGAIENYLPFLTDLSVPMRELLHQHAEDDSWTSSRAVPGRLEVSVNAGPPGARVAMMSALPSLMGVRALAGDRRVVSWTLIALSLLTVLPALAWCVMGYLLRHVFLSDVIDRMWGQGLVPAIDRPILIVCDEPKKVAAQFENAYVLEVTPLASSADPAAAWWQARKAIEAAGPARAVIVPDLDDGMEDRALMQRKLKIVETLVSDPVQAVAVLSSHMPRVLIESAVSPEPEEPDGEHWRLVFDRFAVVEVPPPPGRGPCGWREALLDGEGRPTRALAQIAADLKQSATFASGTLTEEQLLDEFEERARPLYRRDWQACSPDERIALEHVARHGLANAASRPVLRSLLVKGLLRKDPALRLMNRTFTRYVLEGDRRREVVRLESEQIEPSLWDRLRLPLGLGATAAIVFLVTTQRETFDATVTVAAGVTTAVPTLLRLTSLLAQLGGKGSSEAKAA